MIYKQPFEIVELQIASLCLVSIIVAQVTYAAYLSGRGNSVSAARVDAVVPTGVEILVARHLYH